MRVTEGSNTVALAAKLLIAPTALMQLSEEEALTIVSYMVPRESPWASPLSRKVTRATPAT